MTARTFPEIRTWRVDNLFKQNSRRAGVSGVRNNKVADSINVALHWNIRAAFGERGIKHTIFADESVIDTNNALTDVKHLNFSEPTDTRRAPVTADDTPQQKLR